MDKQRKTMQDKLQRHTDNKKEKIMKKRDKDR